MPLAQKDLDYLTMMHNENASYVRQHETPRATATGLFIALIAGILAFAGAVPKLSHYSCVFVCAVSVLGIIVNYKLNERTELHYSRLRGFRDALENEIDPAIRGIRATQTMHHRNQYPVTYDYIKLHILWLVVYAMTFGIGIVGSLM